MTRETKIGLLVGLAFIIVVGILLSDHMTAATERPAAALAEAGRGVQAGVSAPGATNVPAAPPVELPAAPAVAQTPAMPGASQVAIVPPQQQLPIIIRRQSAPAGPTGPTGPGAEPATIENLPPIVTHTPTMADPFANPELAKTASAVGEPVVPVDHPAVPATPAKAEPALAANNAREYKAQPGDTLSRIAALLPGGSTKTNRDAIVKLNPTLQKDPNKVIAGRTYLLPTDLSAVAKAPAAPTAPAPAPAAPLVQAVTPVQPKAVAKADAKSADKGSRVYVVQKGDTLGRIAASECGSSKLVSAIIELNKDVLTDKNLIKVDMKLKLPAKEG